MKVSFNKPNGNYTHTQRYITLKKRQYRGKKYRILPNKNNRQKHKGKKPIDAQSYQKTKDKIAIRNLYTPIITLNVKELNPPTKRHRVEDGIQKQNSSSAAFRRHIKAAKTNTDSKRKGGKQFSKQTASTEKQV